MTDNYIVVNCPHCDLQILIFKNEINCQIFRHGVYKHNHQQMPPHTPKVQCDKLAEEDKIYGCGKPFRIVNQKEAIECGYI